MSLFERTPVTRLYLKYEAELPVSERVPTGDDSRKYFATLPNGMRVPVEFNDRRFVCIPYINHTAPVHQEQCLIISPDGNKKSKATFRFKFAETSETRNFQGGLSFTLQSPLPDFNKGIEEAKKSFLENLREVGLNPTEKDLVLLISSEERDK